MANKTTLDTTSFGLAAGIITALYILFLSFMVKETGWGKEIVDLLSHWYPNYSLTYKGIITGTIWGFVDGFIGGYVMCWIYNWLVNRKK